MSVGGYIRIDLAVYGPEIIGGFRLEKKVKTKKQKKQSGLLSRKNKLWRFVECGNPVIDPLRWET